MLVGVNGEKGTAAMVTLLTEKLQDQSLSDLPYKAYSINLHPEKLSQAVGLFPYELHEKSPWRVISRGCALQTEASTQNAPLPFPVCPFSGPVGEDPPGLRPSAAPCAAPGGYSDGGPSTLPSWISALNLNENGGPPLAPPTKRHCRSLSEPDELARCRSPWRPGSSSKIWTPISKRRCNSGGAASLQRCHSHGNAGPPLPPSSSSSSSSSSSCSFSCGHALLLQGGGLGAAVSPVPRPSSASSGFADGGSGASSASSSSVAVAAVAPAWHADGPHVPRRRLSLSQEHIADAGGGADGLLPSASSTPSSTPELGRRHGLLRCRSQPCVLQERKSGLKRRREDDIRWSRPALNFLKMTRTLKNSKSLCSLDYEDDEDSHAKTVVSSPCDSGDLLASAVEEGSVLLSLGLQPWPPHPHLQSFSSAATVSESEEDEDTSDCDSAEDMLFPLDCADLDLEQIENN
ncbi:protein FAM53A-like [Megalops cyprinoides]|uniref:protein FAM53A-like n=1 Tax=Megalops cyprinoides TaxID=118141 RepID=UPI00186410A6|nr:protein FAM53A-like [Megalops cyprinoides]XP_036407249.1 protein FAM53A-like [Megalops cyprinoides]XP_036407250.1 protein FAM53A-like [Megalops cyprinoides]XP_036407251.1 protein FAM53A-like [Megalops cyprinoides]